MFCLPLPTFQSLELPAHLKVIMPCTSFSLLESSLKMVMLGTGRGPNSLDSSHQVDLQPRSTDHPPVPLDGLQGASRSTPLLSSSTPQSPLAFCPPQGSLTQLFPLSSLYGAGKMASIPEDSDDVLRSFKRNWLQSKLLRLAVCQAHLLIFFKQIFYFEIILDLHRVTNGMLSISPLLSFP